MPQDAEKDVPNVWPPAPTLGPPSPAPRPKLLRLWAFILYGLAGNMLVSAVCIVRQWLEYQTVKWHDDVMGGLLGLALTLMVQLLLQYVARQH